MSFVHNLASYAHNLVYHVHNLVSHAHNLVSHAHNLVSYAHNLVSCLKFSIVFCFVANWKDKNVSKTQNYEHETLNCELQDFLALMAR